MSSQADERWRKRTPRRIVVCGDCGALYDIHYIDNVKVSKNEIYKFECKNCGMVDVAYSNAIIRDVIHIKKDTIEHWEEA